MTKRYVGIDLGGTNLKTGLVSPDGRILGRLTTPTEADHAAFVKAFKQASRRYIKRQFTWFRREPLFRLPDHVEGRAILDGDGIHELAFPKNTGRPLRVDPVQGKERGFSDEIDDGSCVFHGRRHGERKVRIIREVGIRKRGLGELCARRPIQLPRAFRS